MSESKIQNFIRGSTSRPFSTYVQYLMDKHTQKELASLGIGTLNSLPQSIRHLALNFVDRWSTAVHNSDFWRASTSEIASDISEDAYKQLLIEGYADFINDDVLYAFFHLVAINYAQNAIEQPKMRQLAGLRLSSTTKTSSGCLSVILLPVIVTILITSLML